MSSDSYYPASKLVSTDEYLIKRRNGLSWIKDHLGIITLAISITTVFLSFLFYSYQCGRAFVFGISFTQIEPNQITSPLSLLLFLAFACFILITNYIAYYKTTYREKGLLSALALLISNQLPS